MQSIDSIPMDHTIQPLAINDHDAFTAPLIMTDYPALTPLNANAVANAPKTGLSPQHLLSTTSDQTASIIPQVVTPLPTEQDKPSNEGEGGEMAATTTTTTDVTTTANVAVDVPSVPAKDSRWTKDNRVILKQLMGSLPPHDIGAALRVILDTFGVESSKLVRRGNYVELDLSKINDDYILDSLWNYCAQMQYNIMNTLQAQQQQQIQQQMQFQQQQAQQQQMQMQQQVVPINAVPAAMQMAPMNAVGTETVPMVPAMQMSPQQTMNQMHQQFMTTQQQQQQGMVQMGGNMDEMNQQYIVMDSPKQQMGVMGQVQQ